jgi:hypothetical protein
MKVLCRVKKYEKRGDVVCYVEGEGEKKRCEVKALLVHMTPLACDM